mmetsp:Transcript_72208/g.194571  ORF Transcript_72208/g.194571 Transcript_72208/m.194571 type:complete len:275 (-) Transcript_72208:241-1065(-)
MQRCQGGHKDALQGAARECAHTLAHDIVASFDAFCEYLHEVGQCIERVDPHLCNNTGLVARLADWEESWEVGTRYVQQTSMLEAVCRLVAQVKALEALTPVLTQMCEDCDVELFLVLPRIVLLCFLSDPKHGLAQLVKGLLPHHFVQGEGCQETGAGPLTKMDPEFEGLVCQFRNVMQVLAVSPSLKASRVAPEEAAWEVIMRRAIFGSSEAGDLYNGCPAPTKKAIEDMMREVEGWSLDLQRHCPEDWNQFSAVFVQCLLGGKQRDTAAKFQV